MLTCNKLKVVNPDNSESHDATIINALKDEIATLKNQLNAKNNNDPLILRFIQLNN